MRARGLTKLQTATVLGLSPNTVADPRWRRRVGLRAVRVGRALRFMESDVLELVERGRERLSEEARQ